MGLYDDFNNQLLPRLLGHHLRPHMACPRCKARMMMYLTYYLCPVCSTQVNKPKPKPYQHPEDKLASLEEILIFDPSNQPQPPLGYFGASSPILLERSWLVFAGLMLMLFAANFWGFSVHPVYSTKFPALFAWCLPFLGLVHIFAGFAMVSGSLSLRYWAAGLLLVAGLPVVFYMSIKVLSVEILVSGRNEHHWDPTLAKLSFALLAIHAAWSASYLHREAKFMQENSWGED